MKKLNDKGFTLIEMIIAISILGILISLGYGLINNINRSVSKQSQVFSNQTSINVFNSFVSRDLEKSINITNPLTNPNIEHSEESLKTFINTVDKNNPIEYRYELDIGNEKKIKYIVKVEKYTNEKNIYSVNRIDENGGCIEILSKQPIYASGSSIEIPCSITEENNIYYIELGYMDNNKQNLYKFNVKSRIDNI